MRTPYVLGSCVLAAFGALLAFGSIGSSCVLNGPTVTSSTGAGAGGPGGAGGGTACTVVPPGEVCNDPTANLLQVRFSPAQVFVPSCPSGTGCTTRQVKVVVDPDVCTQSAVQFTSAPAAGAAAGGVAPAPAATSINLHQNDATVTIRGGTMPGSTTVTATATLFTNPNASPCTTNKDCMAPQTCSCRQICATPCTTDKDCAGSAPLTSCNQGICAQKETATATLDVEVVDGTPACAGPASTPMLKGGDTLTSGGASISLPTGADNPDQGSFLWGVTPFPATISCPSTDLVGNTADAGYVGLAGYTAVGPAVTFGPVSSVFQREVPLSIPINPALMPTTATLRHLRVAYSGPAFHNPRVVPVADVRVAKVGDQWALMFKAPRLGTYQAVVAPGAGTQHFLRRMTHRAVMGVSMGGGGTASFGMRHHDLFDVLAPLGGPVDWTFLLDYIASNHLGGFRPIAKGTTLKDIQLASTPCMTGADCKSDETCLGVSGTPPVAGRCVLLPKASDPYAHPQTFNTWWYEYPKSGNGGTFDRQSYTQIFRDLAIMYGNPNGDNLTPGGENLPPGVPPTDPSVVGDHPGTQCAVTLDPVCPTQPDGTVPDTCPELAMQQALQQQCPAERCKHTLTLQNYFDDEYNPDGIFPVITVCDGAPQNPALTPYSNTWTSNGDSYPLEVGLAVDYNGNGVRDELEPIIRSGHEPWDDFGTDGLASANEPGYMPGVNDDPNGDDYNAQYNPSGTENNHRFDTGEKFYDVGLDGVAGTKQQPAGGWAKPGDGYDVGESDGKFTASRGLQRFWDRDAHSIVRQAVDPAQVPGGALSDAALARVDLWTDGGLRDLFNFGVDAQHLVGAFAARGRLAGYLTWFTEAPGLDPTMPAYYDPKLTDYTALPGVMLQRYGHIDPSATDIQDGSGQHVGTAAELTGRLQAALYFIGSRWADRSELRLQVEPSSANPAPGAPDCEVVGTCTIGFTSKSGRTGPVGISLPPGYAHASLQHIRYPVIYLLHGYGQSPTDLEAAIALLNNWWNSALNSSASRLPKAIVVYVDGRCRPNPDGSAECLRGTFFGDSPRPGGAQDETWWLELMQYMDQHYRTLGETMVDWVE